MAPTDVPTRLIPPEPARISPKEYEEQVVAWLRASGHGLEDFRVEHLRHLEGGGGDYEFDGVAEFTILCGARITVLIECKRYSRPVERDKMLTLWAKLQDVNAQKAMMFATCGYQSGALQYAESRKIAAVIFVEGRFIYETKGATSQQQALPPGFPEYAGILVHHTGEQITAKTFAGDNVRALTEWLDDAGDASLATERPEQAQ